MKLKGTRTEINILTAFAGESQARNRYTYFASKAKKEGYVQLRFLKRLQIRRRNMQKDFLNFLKAERLRSQDHFLPV